MNVEIIKEKHIHGNVLNEYAQKQTSGRLKTQFDNIIAAYEKYRNSIDSVLSLSNNEIKDIVGFLNAYRKTAIPVFDSVPHSGQTGLGSTIMEEFFYLLFKKKIDLMKLNHENVFIGKGNSYVSLSFTPSSFRNVFENPNANIHTKDQDFVLGANVGIQITADGDSQNTSTVIPIVAIECKTYLERNMLDSCAATAGRLKNAMPYCVYIVASEYMKMLDASPELTDIDEVYILCKAKNADRERRKRNHEEPFEIDADLIIDLFERVERHINAVWWKPDEAVALGKIINRPR